MSVLFIGGSMDGRIVDIGCSVSEIAASDNDPRMMDVAIPQTSENIPGYTVERYRRTTLTRTKSVFVLDGMTIEQATDRLLETYVSAHEPWLAIPAETGWHWHAVNGKVEPVHVSSELLCRMMELSHCYSGTYRKMLVPAVPQREVR